MRKLYLTVVDDCYNPRRDLVLGAWCFVGVEDRYPDWDDEQFVKPYEEVDELVVADRATRELANQYAIKMAEELNRLHDREYSVAYWRSLLILWLVVAVQSYWRRYCHIKKFIHLHGDEPLSVDVMTGELPFRPASLSEYLDLVLYSSTFDFWISSQIIQKLGPSKWKLVPQQTVVSWEQTDDEKLDIISHAKLRPFINSVFGRLSFDSVQGTGPFRILFSILINILPKREYTPRKWKWDDSVLNYFPDNFLILIDGYLRQTTPETVGAGYSALEKASRKKKYIPGRLLIDQIASHSPSFQMDMAQALEAGERLVGFQHGAMDGNSKFTPWSEAEKYYYGWITWGWTKQERISSNLIPLPSPYLNKFRNKHQERQSDLILVGAKIFARGNRFDSVPDPSDYIHYRKDKVTFLNSLNSSVCDNAFYRPFVRSQGTLEDGDYITRKIRGIRLLENNFHAQILKCRLLVLDHPGTTLNIAMAANIPTVCFWNPDHWPQCEQILPLFSQFKLQKMLFENPAAAASFVNEIWSDVDSWWQNSEVQETRKEWAYYYARTSKLWWIDWFKAIWRLSNDNPITKNIT